MFFLCEEPNRGAKKNDGRTNREGKGEDDES